MEQGQSCKSRVSASALPAWVCCAAAYEVLAVNGDGSMVKLANHVEGIAFWTAASFVTSLLHDKAHCAECDRSPACPLMEIH